MKTIRSLAGEIDPEVKSTIFKSMELLPNIWRDTESGIGGFRAFLDFLEELGQEDSESPTADLFFVEANKEILYFRRFGWGWRLRSSENLGYESKILSDLAQNHKNNIWKWIETSHNFERALLLPAYIKFAGAKFLPKDHIIHKTVHEFVAKFLLDRMVEAENLTSKNFPYIDQNSHTKKVKNAILEVFYANSFIMSPTSDRKDSILFYKPILNGDFRIFISVDKLEFSIRTGGGIGIFIGDREKNEFFIHIDPGILLPGIHLYKIYGLSIKEKVYYFYVLTKSIEKFIDSVGQQQK